jgi:hypothetical protein
MEVEESVKMMALGGIRDGISRGVQEIGKESEISADDQKWPQRQPGEYNGEMGNPITRVFDFFGPQ